MRKLADGIYTHRGNEILKDEQGIWVAGWMHLFKTYTDARYFIDKITDGTNKREPIIIGEWKIPE